MIFQLHLHMLNSYFCTTAPALIYVTLHPLPFFSTPSFLVMQRRKVSKGCWNKDTHRFWTSHYGHHTGLPLAASAQIPFDQSIQEALTNRKVWWDTN